MMPIVTAPLKQKRVRPTTPLVSIIEMALSPADYPVDQLWPADQSDATRRGVSLKKFLVGETFDNDGFRHAIACHPDV